MLVVLLSREYNLCDILFVTMSINLSIYPPTFHLNGESQT